MGRRASIAGDCRALLGLRRQDGWTYDRDQVNRDIRPNPAPKGMTADRSYPADHVPEAGSAKPSGWLWLPSGKVRACERLLEASIRACSLIAATRFIVTTPGNDGAKGVPKGGTDEKN
jgi:hypothetical protein